MEDSVVVDRREVTRGVRRSKLTEVQSGCQRPDIRDYRAFAPPRKPIDGDVQCVAVASKLLVGKVNICPEHSLEAVF